MRKNYEDPAVTVTKFEYEEIMTEVVSGEIPDNGGDWGDQ